MNFFRRLMVAAAYRKGHRGPGGMYIKCRSWREAWAKAGRLLA